MITTYTIPDFIVDDVKHKIEKFNKASVKAKIEPISYTLENSRTEIRRDNEDSPEYEVSIIDLVIDGELFINRGWEFLAQIEHSDEGNVILKKNDNFQVPEEYRTASIFTCDHCHTRRYRTYTYLVKNIESNEIKQVGSDCIRAYLGFNLNALLDRLEWLNELKKLGLLGSDSEYNGERLGGRWNPIINLKSYMTMVVGLMTVNPFYITSKLAYESGQTSSASEAWYLFDTKLTSYQKELLNKINVTNEKNTETAVDLINYFTTLLNGKTERNDYEGNLLVVLNRGYVTPKTMGIAGSMWIGYKKHIEGEFFKKEKKISNWIGKEGDKIELPLFVKRTNSMENPFKYNGVTYIHTMIDTDGNIFTWFNNGNNILDDEKTYMVRGTIKKHDSYNDIKKTVLTRCKAIEVEVK